MPKAKSTLGVVLQASQQQQEEEINRQLLASIEIIEGFNNPEIAKLLKEHDKKKPKEAAAFEGYRWLDDLLNATTVTDPRKFGQEEYLKKKEELLEVRRTKLHAINDSMQAAVDRQNRLFAMIAPYKNNPECKDAYREAGKQALRMTNHLPDKWFADRKRLSERIDALCQSEEEKENIKTKALLITDEKHKAERDKETAIFREVIEHGSLSGMDRTQFYFDVPLLSITPEQNVRLMKTNEKIIARAYQIHDSGGTVEEVEASLAHIPPEFWPPAFIRNIQAWRKVERELAEERIKAMMDKKDPSKLSAAKDIFDFAMDTIGFVGITTDLGGFNSDGSHGATANQAFIPCAWRDAPAAVEATTGFLAAVQSCWGYGADVLPRVKEALANDTMGELLEEMPELEDLPKRIAEENHKYATTMAKIADELTKAASAGIGIANNVGWALSAAGNPGAATFAAETIPVLCAVAAGIDLTRAIASLGKAIHMRGKTSKMLDQAEMDWVSGKSKDGGALARAIINERDARNRQIGKKSVDVTAKGAVFAGEVALTSAGGTGVGAAVGLGLKITGKSIEYGGKVVFAGIDWSIAKNAKLLIQEAQAGNPVARMQIMEDSGLYAKMYIAILAREGDTLATKFITDRGITEEDLRKPAMALSVLREAMLEHADQKDETQVSDNLGRAIAEEVAGEGTVRVAKGISNLPSKAVSAARAKKYPYNSKWKPFAFPEDPTQWSKAWSDTKNAAETQAGLAPAKTGLKAALAACPKPFAQANDAVSNLPNNGGTQEQKDAVYKIVSTTLSKFDKALALARSANPVNNKGELHEPMAKYFASLSKILMERRNTLDLSLFAFGIKQTDWAPDKRPSVNPDVWRNVWSKAVIACKVPKDDGGIGAALAKAHEAQTKIVSGSETPLIQRQLRIERRDSLAAAAYALKSLWTTTSEFPELDQFVQETMSKILAASRENDEELRGKPWAENPAKQPEFTSTMWSKTLTAAVAAGFLKSASKDEGVGKAIKSWEAAHKETGGTKDVSALIEARLKETRKLADVAKAVEKLIAANKDTHDELIAYFLWIRKKAGEEAGKLRRLQADIKFHCDVELSEEAFQTTIDNAVKAGAVSEGTSAKKAMSSLLAKYHKGVTSLNSDEGTAKKRFQLAESLVAQLVPIQKAISKVQDMPGYGANDQMENYLLKLRDLAAKAPEESPIKDVLEGEPGSFQNTEFKWGDKAWQTVKKEADKAGLIQKSRNKTGFGAAMKAVDSKKKKLSAAKSNTEKEELKRTVIEKIDTFIAIANGLKASTPNKNFKDYFYKGIKYANEVIKTLS